MISKLTVLLFFGASTLTLAGGITRTVYIEGGTVALEPSFATDGHRISIYDYDVNGNTLFCPTYRLEVEYVRSLGCTLKGTKLTAWVFMKDYPPKGKTFAGFSMSSGYYYIYWK